MHRRVKHFADVTLAYTETSGGIRTYIDQKRRYLREETDFEHTLIIPGEKDEWVVEGRLAVQTIRSPMIPGCKPYRFFWRTGDLLRALHERQPDVVELGSFLTCPFPVFKYREELTAKGRDCRVNGYFHTDLASAYFSRPLQDLLPDGESESGSLVHELGDRFAEWVAKGAEGWFGSIFAKCDRIYAATPAQADRVRQYGIKDVGIIPLGVDLEQFHPGKRNPKLRTELGIGEDEYLCVYAGRFDAEKSVLTLIDAIEATTDPRIHFLMAGEGPLREEMASRAKHLPALKMIPYISDKDRLAEVFASADCYITAGPNETFGLSIVEAQACGLPVVGVRAGALTERVPEGYGRLVPVGDGAAMAGAIREVLAEGPELRNRCRERIVDEGYGWGSTFRRWVEASTA